MYRIGILYIHMYTKTMGGKIFNQKQVVEDIAINVSVSNIQCDCHRNMIITVIIMLLLWPCWKCCYGRP